MPVYLLFKSTIYPIDTTLDPAGCDFVYGCSTLSSVTALLANDVSVAVNKFYNVMNTGQSQLMVQWMPPSMNATRGLNWAAYDITAHLDGTPHGAPIASGVYSISTMSATSAPLPEGVAAAISYRGDYGTDVEFVRDPVTHKVTQRPRARHRGRIFFGPIIPGALLQDPTTKRARLSASFINDALFALQGIASITDSGSNKWTLGHWSKKNASVEPIIQAWIDDRPDYQRRRADQSTTRTTVSYTYP